MLSSKICYTRINFIIYYFGQNTNRNIVLMLMLNTEWGIVRNVETILLLQSAYVKLIEKTFFLMVRSTICKVKRELGQELHKGTKTWSKVKNQLIEILLIFKCMAFCYRDQLLISSRREGKQFLKRRKRYLVENFHSRCYLSKESVVVGDCGNPILVTKM